MSDKLTWFKSSYSDNEGGDCVETAIPTPRTTIHIRDSKYPSGPQLTVTALAWEAFISAAHPGA
ncbi:DUF397 domain-containing protein [Streptomyces sp. NPDC101776]|uniref:DUF397 domain-containing protein n=1 Tax=Streptomyces sp. NPDC101776 TaxID=3366146 RepID=UPI003827F01F